MGNLKMDKINLSFTTDEFYCLQDIVTQWYRENHSKYDGFFEEHPLIKVANGIRNITPIKIDGTLTIS